MTSNITDKYFSRSELYYRRWESEAIDAFLIIDKYAPMPIDPNATSRKKTHPRLELYSAAQVFGAERSPAFRCWRALGDRAGRRECATEAYRQRLEGVVSSLELDLPALDGASPAQIGFGLWARQQALFYFAIVARQLISDGVLEEDAALEMVKNVVTGTRGKDSTSWIGHFRRIANRCLDPFEYWTGILKSALQDPGIPASKAMVTAGTGAETVHELRACA